MQKPELLAPAGNLEALRSALIGGADAVYFGLNVGFNARAKSSADLTLENLPELLKEIHGCGSKAYITLNTLVFEDELPQVAEIIKSVAAAGTDAIIVQDVGLALLAKRHAPQLKLHASTQMTVSSSPAMEFARQLGMSRVVLPRELSLDEIATIVKSSPLETEVFILGALCMSYSGQCLASLAWGGRSANRGQCAQACRLPYQAIIDGQERHPADHPAQLLSPRDQAGLTEVGELARLGVTSLKVEGRLKGPNYVYMAATAIRHRLDHDDPNSACPYLDNLPELRRDFTDLSLTYSRGFGHGFLRGIDHKKLVSPLTPQHHGVLLGTISAVRGRTITVPRPWDDEAPSRHAEAYDEAPTRRSRPREVERTQARPSRSATSVERDQQCLPVTPQKGMGVLIVPASSPISFQNPNPGLGGPLFEVRKTSRTYELTFGHIGPNLERVAPGDKVYITSSPLLGSEIKTALKGTPSGHRALSLQISGQAGQPLCICAQSGEQTAQVASASALQPAQRRALDEAGLREALGSLGGTPFHLASLDCSGLETGLFLPLSELKPLRRQLLEALQSQDKAEATQPAERILPPAPPWMTRQALPHLSALCRTAAQIEAALEMGIDEIELEYYPQHPAYGEMEHLVHKCPSAKLTLSTPRLHKDGEEHLLERLLSQHPAAVMVRSLGALVYLRLQNPELPIDGDFSLNVTNSVSARYFFSCGVQRLVLSDDLDLRRTCLLTQTLAKYRASNHSVDNNGNGDRSPLSERLVLPIYRHIPAFYTQHCFFAERLSELEHPAPGKCGMPCKKHTLAFQDRLGQVHPVYTDACCRNIIYDGLPKNTIEHLSTYWKCGLRQYRVEFLQETPAEVRTIIGKIQESLRKLQA